MELLLLFTLGLVCLFGAVVVVGAPYLPTLKRQHDAIFELLDLSPGSTLLELGAGDGTVALAALQKGYRVTAIELNPVLCVVIFFRTLKYRRGITIKCANFWTTDWGEYDGIYTFLLDKYMTKLDKKIVQNNKNTLLASYAFRIPNRLVTGEKNGVFLYRYGRVK